MVPTVHVPWSVGLYLTHGALPEGRQGIRNVAANRTCQRMDLLFQLDNIYRARTTALIIVSNLNITIGFDMMITGLAI